MITENLKKLNTIDIYSLILFVMYKMRDIPEFRTLSELVYIFDRSSFIKLCEYFGGKTIKIPTLDELEVVLYCLLIYEDVKAGADFEQRLNSLPVPAQTKKDISDTYAEMAEVLREYEFVPR